MSIQVEQLTKFYGNQKAVDSISFEINPGEVVGFLGPNGAGKSTTMKIITCFIPQTSGSAVVCGHDVSRNPMEARRQIGYLPENNPLYRDLYVREYMEFLAGLHKLGKNSKKRIAEMIEITGLQEESMKKIGELSKGYKQRVGLAQAMIHNPNVLILDEPTSGLDPNQLADIRSLIKELGKEKTVLLSTHIMQEVQAICDRVIIIHKGQIVADDTTDQLTQKMQQDEVIILEFEEQVEKNHLEAIKGVSRVESVSANKWSLTGAVGKDLRQNISAFAVENSLTLLTMQKEEKSLEDVFKQLTK